MTATGERWHARAAEDALRHCDSRPEGLSEAEAARRLRTAGPNALHPRRPVPLWRVGLEQLQGTITLLLVIAVAVALLSGERLDAAAIGAALVLNAGIGFATQLRANRAIAALAALEPREARVRRGGLLRQEAATGLVTGDIIDVQAGDRVPADARLLESDELTADESTLTGESFPVAKQATATLPTDTPLAERATMIYQGTMISAGRGSAVVVATAMDTEVGRIGQLLAGVRRGRTPLEERLETLGRQLAVAAISVAALIALIDAQRAIAWQEIAGRALALAVAAIPEGLPLVASLAMAIGMRRMARRRALIRRLPAVETLGCTTTICADKTGTLTQGRMHVIQVWPGPPDGDGAAGTLGPGPLAEALARSSDVAYQGDGIPLGDPLDVTLQAAAQAAGAGPPRSPRREDVIPFSSSRLWSGVAHQVNGRRQLWIKGAPERVMAMCERWHHPAGEVALDDAAREAILTANSELAGRALRVVALARGAMPSGPEPRGMTFLGLVGLADPVAADVRETIEKFQAAGIDIMMITGDQGATAAAIAGQLGLLHDGRSVASGAELERATDAELAARLPGIAVVSRASPESKLRIVAALRRNGQIVAMLGDGVNDAAALRQADIGVAMGRRGTDLAREAADLVLADDRFATIGEAIEQGRAVFANIRRFVFYLFSCNLAEILTLLVAGLTRLPSLLPLQILWLNLVTDSLPALALAAEPPEPDLMRRRPRSPREAVLPGREIRATLVFAGLIAAVTLLALALGQVRGPDYGTTMAFHTLALAQLFHLGNARSDAAVTSLRRAFANPGAILAVVLVLALQAATALVDPLARMLRVEPLLLPDLLLVVLLGAVPAVTGQLMKRVASSRSANGALRQPVTPFRRN